MYLEIPQGSTVDIQGLLCHVPPEGHVWNIVTKQLEYRGVYQRSEKIEEQYWERFPLPSWYKSVIKAEDEYEKKKKPGDAEFYDDRYERFKQQEWDRRLNGFWVRIKGRAVYLTGPHYLYLQWFSIDIGYPKFRIPDLEYFYFLQYTIEDPESMGMIEITKRRFGKCFKINTLVRMYDGSVKKIQDIVDGDFVMGDDSQPRMVYGKTSGHEEMYEIVPKKGEPFTVNKSHIIYGVLAGNHKEFEITVEDYLNKSESAKSRMLLKRTGWEYDERSVEIDPYFLGIWLGDGSSRNCEVCNEDIEIIDYLKLYANQCGLNYRNYGARTKKGVQLRHSLSKKNAHTVKYEGITYSNKTELMGVLGKHPKTPLKTLGLFKSGKVESVSYADNWLWEEMLRLKLKNNKHIPDDYKINSRSKRLELLAGIIDSDGCLVENNHYKIAFSNKYQSLIDDTVELVQSLGFFCGQHKDKKVNATILTIFGDIHLIPARIKRKKAAQTIKKYDSLLTGFDVNPVGIDKYFGFAVDDNHLFLLADGTIVHNTFRAGLFLIEYVTRTKMTNAGIQSKTGGDAKKVFSKAVVAPFKKLPKFFRPEYDMSLGITPKTEMRFQQTNIRGKKAEEGLDKDELGSMIDHQSADVVAYDGQKLHRYVADESGKTSEVNIYDRHDVIRYCLLDDEGRIIGKALYTTTVEKLDSEKDGVQEAFKNLWNDSNQLDRKENGRTASGLYRFFMTADRGRNFDIYGEPDVEKTIKEIIADRKSVAHNLRALSARIRKEARTIEEAFSTDSDKCIFNVINLDNRGRELRERPPVKRYVLFERQLDQTIKWKDVDPKNTNFYWKITAFPPPGQANRFLTNSGIRKPGRTSDGGIAIDGYSNSQGGKYGSKASAWIGRRFDILDPLNSGKAIGHLYGRPAIKEMLHEQVMMAAEYYGYLAWYEHNSDDYLSYFRERGKIGYLGTYPLSTIDPIKRKDADRYRGFPTTPFSLTKQVDTGIAYVENYSHLIDFEELIEDLKKFDPNNRTEFDISVSWLMLLVILMEPIRVPEKTKEPLVKVYENPLYGKTSLN